MKRRWLFITFLIILVLAVVLTIVFVNLFRDKNTMDLAKDINRPVTSGYLDKESDENKEFKDYITLIGKEKFDYSDDANEYLQAISGYEIYLSFFNRQIVFAQYTDVYKTNRKKIASSLNDAQKSADQLKAYLDEHKSAEKSTTWLNQTWQDCSGFVTNIIQKTNDAIKRLCAVYQDCVKTNVLNNDYTKAIFTATEDMLEKLESDEKTDSGKHFAQMAQAYLIEEKQEIIIKFQDNAALKTKIETILGINGKESSEYQDLLEGKLV